MALQTSRSQLPPDTKKAYVLQVLSLLWDLGRNQRFRDTIESAPDNETRDHLVQQAFVMIQKLKESMTSQERQSLDAKLDAKMKHLQELRLREEEEHLKESLEADALLTSL